MLIRQVPVPVQAPVQPAKASPAAGDAVSVRFVFQAKVLVQPLVAATPRVMTQLIPVAPDTVPLPPEPVPLTVSRLGALAAASSGLARWVSVGRVLSWQA